jgi:hypothetical protein
MAVEASFPTRQQNSQGDFQSGAILADLKIVRKIEGTKLEGKDVKLGMFQLYRKNEDIFLPLEFKAVPVFWCAYNIVWDLGGKFLPGQPPALISIYDENKSIRWNPDAKEYEQGPLVYGDEDSDIPPCRPFEEHGTPGLLVYFLLEDERIGRMHLRFKDQDNFTELAKTIDPFTPILVKSKKGKNKQGQAKYSVEFESAKGFAVKDIQSFVDKVKAEVEEMVNLQQGIVKKENSDVSV